MTEVQRVDYGWYLLNDGDTPTSVARRVYGDPMKSGALLQANPEDWRDLERVRVPNKKGRITTLQDGESPQMAIQRMFPSQPMSIYLQPFFTWNGGEYMKLYPGDEVFVPER